MPKRSTLTFSSEDAPPAEEEPLHVYYCKYSGQHCFITDASLSSLPRRRTDGSYILDTKKYIVRMSLNEQAPKLIKRDGGAEKQIRFHTRADLPVCYQSETDGQFLYVLMDAVTAYTDASAAAERRAPVPPCIQRMRGGGVQVTLSLEDKGRECALISVLADEVKFSVTQKADHSATELLDLLGKILHVRLPQLSLLKARKSRWSCLLCLYDAFLPRRAEGKTVVVGPLASWMSAQGLSTRSKMLVVNGMSPQQVFDRLQMHLAGEANKGPRTHGGAIPNVQMPPPPPRQPAEGAGGNGAAAGAGGDEGGAAEASAPSSGGAGEDAEGGAAGAAGDDAAGAAAAAGSALD